MGKKPEENNLLLRVSTSPQAFFWVSLNVPIALTTDCLFPQVLPSPRPQKSHVKRVTGGHLGIALRFPLRFPAEDCKCT
jgi:hypothetical protein